MVSPAERTDVTIASARRVSEFKKSASTLARSTRRCCPAGRCSSSSGEVPGAEAPVGASNLRTPDPSPKSSRTGCWKLTWRSFKSPRSILEPISEECLVFDRGDATTSSSLSDMLEVEDNADRDADASPGMICGEGPRATPTPKAAAMAAVIKVMKTRMSMDC